MAQRKKLLSPLAQMARRAKPLAGLGIHLGRGVGRLGANAALRSYGTLPRRADDLTPQMLSRLMGRSVSSISEIGSSDGTSSRVRLALTGDDVPESVFVKMSAMAAGTRMLGELAGLGETEVRFYTRLAAELPAGVPRLYGSGFSPWTGRFILVLEDLAARDTRFPDTTQPLGLDEAREVVRALARVHAKYWGRLPVKRGGSSPLGWLWTPSDYPSVPLVGPIMRLSLRRMAERSSIPVRNGAYIVENYAAVMRQVDALPHTVLHGDTHPGNLYFCDGEAGLLDWQMVRRGHPMRDVAYAMIFGLTTEDRRAHQRELLDEYRDAFAAAGGPLLQHEDIWLRYRKAAAYAFTSILSTSGLGGMQSEEIALTGLRRAVAALEDLDTVAALQHE